MKENKLNFSLKSGCKTLITRSLSSEYQEMIIIQIIIWIPNLKGSHIEVYSDIEFPKFDSQFNYDIKCCVYVAILHHSELSYNMF